MEKALLGGIKRASSAPAEPRRVKLDGRQALIISLYGPLGRGRDVTVDPADWKWISERYGKLWRAFRAPHDQLVYVGSRTKQAVAAAREDGIDVGDDDTPLVLLARVIAKPRPGERVYVFETHRFDFRSGCIRPISDELVTEFRRTSGTRYKFIAVA